MLEVNQNANSFFPLPNPDECICFLTGAGSSSELPGTRSIIKAILYVLGKSLGEKEAKSFSNAIVKQTVLSRDVLFPVRLEYLLQLVKDYFQSEFTFFQKLMDCKCTPNTYHRTLARLLDKPGHVIFTTNFDKQLENASKRQAVYRDEQYDKVDISNQLIGIFKLHGSIDDTRTLGVTFDSTTKTAHQHKRKVLRAGLIQGSLCVIGYSGGDDTDVVPTLLSTDAFRQKVYWFQHLKDVEVKKLVLEEKEYKYYSLSDSNSVPQGLKEKQSYRILEQMINNGCRDANKVFLIAGKTESAFKEFIRSRKHVVIEEREQKGFSQAWINRVVENWYENEIVLPDIDGEDKDIVAAIIGAVLTHIVGKEHMPQEFGNVLESLCQSKPEWYPIALPKLAMVSYDAGNNTKAAEQAQAAQKTFEENNYDNKKIPPRLVEEARIDSYVWQAEAMRMANEPQKTIEVAMQGLKKTVSIDRLPEFKRLQRLKGDLHAAIGESYLVLGQLTKAITEYQRSIRYMENAAEWNWYWYGQLGVADILRSAGYLQASLRHYKFIQDGANATGWRTWFAAQTRVSEFDIIKTQRIPLNEDQMKDLEWLASEELNTYDENIVNVAKAIRWDIDWIFKRKTKEQLYWEYRKLINMAEGDEDNIASLGLSHAEYLKHCDYPTKLDKAQKEALSVIKYARTAGLKLLELHASMLCEDINRLMRKSVDWRPLAAQYRKYGCIIGEMYATAIGMLAGAKIPSVTFIRMYDIACSNKIVWAQKVFMKDDLTGTSDIETWLLFPGVVTTF